VRNLQTGFKEKWQWFSDRWFAHKVDDPIQASKGYTVKALTFALTVIIFISLPLGAASSFYEYISPLFFLVLYILARRGYINFVGGVVVLLFALLSMDSVGDLSTLDASGLLVLAVSVVLAGVLIGPKAIFVTAVGSGVLGFWAFLLQNNQDAPFIAISYLMLAGLTYLLLHQVRSALGQSERYARELEQSRSNLGSEIAERTRELQRSFNLTSQASELINRSTTLEELFAGTVELIQERFNFSHVHIYTYVPNLARLIIAYGSGTAGQRLKEEAYTIELGQGVVGVAAQTKQALIVNNVEEFPDFIHVPLLQNTRAEMAIPLGTGSNLLGLLDIQDNNVNAFTETDLELMQSLANQLTVAINNFRLVAETEQALAQIEALNARLTREGWDYTLQHAPISGYIYISGQVTALIDNGQQVSAQKSLITDEVNDLDDQLDPSQAISIPIKLRGQLIGVLELEREANNPWREEDEIVVQSVSQQIALALERARLFEDSQRNAWRDHLVSEATAQVWTATEIERVLQTAVAQLGDRLGASEVVIRLGTDSE
jgi:GAF domain-containing protein